MTWCGSKAAHKSAHNTSLTHITIHASPHITTHITPHKNALSTTPHIILHIRRTIVHKQVVRNERPVG